MNNNQQVTEPIRLTAPGETIKANIRRLYGGIKQAEKATGINRQAWYDQINGGEITVAFIGRLYQLGVDPKELVREI